MRRSRGAARLLVLALALVLHVGEALDWPLWLDASEAQIARKVLAECLERDTRACFAEKLTRALDSSIDWDIPIFDGITLRRNSIDVNSTSTTTPSPPPTEDSRRLHAGMDQLYNAIGRFIDAHTLTLDFGDVAAAAAVDEDPRTIGDLDFRAGGYGGGGGFGGGGFGGGGFGGGKKKIGKKEKRRVQYTLMVLLGIFALTVPLALKTLGLMAGKALISSKMALIMLGSIALKKIFQADHHSPVKVHTHTIPIHEEDHDRYDYSGYNYHPVHNHYTKSPLNLL